MIQQFCVLGYALAYVVVVSKQIPYKEDWEAEKQQVYYPVHITPEYEASSDVKKVQSDVSSLNIFKYLLVWCLKTLRRNYY